MLETINVVESEQLNDETDLFMQNSISEALSAKKATPPKRMTLSSRPKSKDRAKASPSNKKPDDPFALKPLEKWFSFSGGFVTGLSPTDDEKRVSAKLSAYVSPVKNFFAGATFFKTLNRYSNVYYEPDFYYSFGYRDWRDNTWSFIYSNYANNKFSPQKDEGRFNFDEGVWDLSYKHSYKGVSLRYAFNYTEKPYQASLKVSASKKVGEALLSAQYKRYLEIDQDQLTLSAKGYLYKKLYASLSLYLYSDRELKYPYTEADYAFSIGWKETEKGKISIVYSNYYLPNRLWYEGSSTPLTNGLVSISMRF